MIRLSRQLSSILWKNWLLKIAHPWSTAAEILLPVLFMAILILIKLVTKKYDSPNIAFYCGNAYPWNYASSVNDLGSLATCITKPTNCSEDNYYNGGYSIVNPNGDYVHLYDEYGYTDSASSSGAAINPFYSKFTYRYHCI
jgi:hypothetical protein